MARGRLISSEITGDKKINELSSDTCRLTFTWLIPFADCEGRTHGDPAMVRSMIFPRRNDITADQVESFIRELADAKLIIWYEACGDWWIAFPNFDKHQNIRKDREAPSKIPPPPSINDAPAPEQVQSNSGVNPEQVPVNLNESNLNHIKANDDNVFAVYEQEIGPLTPNISEELKVLEKEYTAPWVIDAMHRAAQYNKRNLNYFRAILKRWKAEGHENGDNKPAKGGNSLPGVLLTGGGNG